MHLVYKIQIEEDDIMNKEKIYKILTKIHNYTCRNQPDVHYNQNATASDHALHDTNWVMLLLCKIRCESIMILRSRLGVNTPSKDRVCVCTFVLQKYKLLSHLIKYSVFYPDCALHDLMR